MPLVLLSLVLLLLPQNAAAESTAAPVGYDALIAEALGEFDAQNFQEALALFRQAHELQPNAQTLRALGMTEFELRHYTECIVDLEQALDSSIKSLRGDSRQATEQLLVRAYRFVAAIEVVARPSESIVRIDGRPADRPAARGVVLDAGEHLFEVSASNHVSESRRLVLKAGERKRLAISLKAEDSPVVLSTRVARKEESQSVLKNPWLWTAIGVVIVGAATGLAIAFTRSAEGERPFRGNTNTLLIGPTQ